MERKRTVSRLGFTTYFVVLLMTHSAAGQTYRVIDLGDMGGRASIAFSINELGQVVGSTVDTTGAWIGLYWDASISGLSPPWGSAHNACFDINESGQIASQSYTLGEMSATGVLWTANVPTDLDLFASRGMNDAGEIVGYISVPGGTIPWVDHAAHWLSGITTDLGTLGGSFSYAAAINNNGRIVGWSFTSGDQITRATQWVLGVPSDLGSLLGGGTPSQAYDISDSGHIVGCSDTSGGQPHAFLFVLGPGGNVSSRTDLGTLDGGYSYAYGVNNDGVAVGTSDGKAFLWNGTMVELQSLLPASTDWQLDIAWAINDRGDIVGMGRRNSFPRAFMMTTRRLGDADDDGDVDWIDYASYFDCLTGPLAPSSPGCEPLDFDGDQNIDLRDILSLQEMFLPPA